MKTDHLNIKTKHLILRPFSLNDVEDCYQMNLDTAVSKYTGDGGVVSKQEIRRRITDDVLGDYKIYGYGRLAVTLKSTGRFMGFAGLKYLTDLEEVDLGYRFMSKYWGKGYATEAATACLALGFDKLGLTKIIAMVLPENKASIRVLEKLGFSFEKEIMENGELTFVYAVYKN